MEELQIVYLDPHDLTPYENNARKHAQADVEQIAESIRVDGFNDPIGIWGDKNLIVEGHGRQLASIELGLNKVPCIRLDHLTDAQRRDYAIRHNFTSDRSEFDFERLREEMAALELQGMDMSYLDALSEEVKEMCKPENVEEGPPEDNTEKPVCVKIVFDNAKEWRAHESEIRELTDKLDARVSVGGDDENIESDV